MRYRLKLLAVIIVSVVIAAYAGSGLASGGPEEAYTKTSDEGQGGARSDDERDVPPQRPVTEEGPATTQTRAGFSPSVPFSYRSFNKNISVVEEDASSIVTKARAGKSVAKADEVAKADDAGLDNAGARAADTDDLAESSIPRVAAPGEQAVETDVSPPASSIPATPASYNAETYCRTYERRAPASSSTKSRAVFPLPEDYFDSYDDTWGAARPQGGHEGTDMMSPAGTPEYAITDGTVATVSGSNGNGWNYLGGYTVMIQADNGIGPVKEGDLFYYAHMDRESVLPIGTEVEAGEQVGVVGDTGYGPEGTRGQFPPHLHLGWYDMTGTKAEAPSGAMNPYPLLEWLKRNGGTASGGWGPERASEAYCDYQERVAAEPPAAEDNGRDHDLPPGISSGSSADLDTGSPDPSPSPVAKRQVDRSKSGSRAVARPPRTDHGPSRELPRAGKIVSGSPQGSNPRPSPEPPPNVGRDTEAAGGGDPDAKRSERPARTPERKKEPETPPSSSSPEPQEPEEPATPGNPPPPDINKKPPPTPDKPELDSEEPTPSRPVGEAPEPDEGNEPARRSSILPVVFHDEDADGVRESGEREIPDWSVKVRGPGAVRVRGKSGDPVEDLKPGEYRVSVETEAGNIRTIPARVRVRARARYESVASFGFAEASDLSELTVRVCGGSRDGESCIRDGEESPQWKLELRDEQGRVISVATTLRDGEHTFRDLLPGLYELTATPRHADSYGEPESRQLTFTGGDPRRVRLRERDPPGAREGRENTLGTFVETPAREIQKESQ